MKIVFLAFSRVRDERSGPVHLVRKDYAAESELASLRVLRGTYRDDLPMESVRDLSASSKVLPRQSKGHMSGERRENSEIGRVT